MGIGVGRVVQRPSIRGGALEELALPESVSACVPRSLIGGEVSCSRSASCRTIGECSMSYTNIQAAVERTARAALRRLVSVLVVVVSVLDNVWALPVNRTAKSAGLPVHPLVDGNKGLIWPCGSGR